MKRDDDKPTATPRRAIAVYGLPREWVDDPARDLAVGVIRQALSDLHAVQTNGRGRPSTETRKEAREWFEDMSRRPGSLEWWAAFTGRPAADYRLAAHRVAEIGPGWRLTEARA
jgi:hypothetical protein